MNELNFFGQNMSREEVYFAMISAYDQLENLVSAIEGTNLINRDLQHQILEPYFNEVEKNLHIITEIYSDYIESNLCITPERVQEAEKAMRMITRANIILAKNGRRKLLKQS